MTNYRATEKIGRMVDSAIERHSQGERILWEPQLMPGPQGEAMLVCFFWVPGLILGETMQGSFPITNPLGVTEVDVDSLVSEFLRRMGSAMSDQIESEKPSQPVQDVIRGQQRASGLLIP